MSAGTNKSVIGNYIRIPFHNLNRTKFQPQKSNCFKDATYQIPGGQPRFRL